MAEILPGGEAILADRAEYRRMHVNAFPAGAAEVTVFILVGLGNTAGEADGREEYLQQPIFYCRKTLASEWHTWYNKCDFHLLEACFQTHVFFF